jgi:hypothetical protein
VAEYRDPLAKFSAGELKMHLEEVRNVKVGRTPAVTTCTIEKNTKDAPIVGHVKTKKEGKVATCAKRKKIGR